MNIEHVAELIDFPVESWAGNCCGVAKAMVDAGLIVGVVRYGHWLGEVSLDSYFADRRVTLPFIPHGWIECDDGEIVDPTRWAFTAEEPFVWIGQNDGSYDVGGNRMRARMTPPVPAYNDDARKMDMILPDPVLRMMGFPPAVTVDHAFWLGNLSLPQLGEFAYIVYYQLARVGMKAAIPIDNWRMVMGDG